VTSGLEFTCTLPDWIEDHVDFDRPYPTAEDKMRLVLDLALRNVAEQHGGPFGAAVFDNTTDHIVGPGVNLVIPASNPTAHAEIVAIAVAGSRLGQYDLGSAGKRPTTLVASTEPCAMCLGATPWSGVSALIVGARDEDARAIGFDEGSKPDDWVAYLESRGISVELDVLRDEAADVLRQYMATGGEIYNATETEEPQPNA
jgi:tRNA(Arg) A34 adenosine deaminase TadA